MKRGDSGMEREQIRISVRNLVEFILRSGDIDNRKSRAMQAEAMQEGSRKTQPIRNSKLRCKCKNGFFIKIKSFSLLVRNRTLLKKIANHKSEIMFYKSIHFIKGNK